MTDTNMTDNKMSSNKICKCENAIADLLGRIDGFSETDYEYGDITNVEYSVVLMREEQQHSMNVFNKVSEMTTTTNLTVFRLRIYEALNDILYLISKQVRQCSI